LNLIDNGASLLLGGVHFHRVRVAFIVGGGGTFPGFAYECGPFGLWFSRLTAVLLFWRLLHYPAPFSG